MASEREQMTGEVTHALDSALERLHKIWTKIGIVEEQRKDRMNVVMLHLRNLLDEMVNEEERLKDKVVANVESLSDQLMLLCKELGLERYEPQEGVSMLQLERELRTRVDKLMSEKNDRMKKFRKLRAEDQHLCDVLQHEPYYIPSNSVPTKEQIRGITEHIQELSKEKARRYKIFKTTKENIIKFMEDLEQAAETSFEREIIHEEDSFQLTNGQLKSLKELHDELEQKTQNNFALAKSLRERIEQLWERLEVVEEERSKFSAKSTGYRPTVINILKDEISRLECIMLENMQKVIECTRKELLEWWNKCYISETQQRKFKPFYEDDFSEDALKAHDQEVSRVKQYYKENEEMLEKVAKRQKLWEEFLEFERKASDPNRLFNRGCNLLKEEKARKKLMKELPKVEQEVREQVEAWEKEKNREFLIDGSRFVDYIHKQWLEYNDAKENEKAQRHQAKVKETEQEMMYGSKPTPGKRRMGVNTTPSKTPNKIRKISGEDNQIPCDSVSSQSSVASSVHSTVSNLTTPKSSAAASGRPPIARVKGRVRQMNDTQKTPGSISRLGRTTMYSPMCMPPRSASKTPGMKNMGPSSGAGKPDQTPNSRRVLGEKNRMTKNETQVFSQTTISGSSTASSSSTMSLKNQESIASLQTYNDFERGLNPRERPNCRSSVVPRPTMYL